MKKRPAKSKKSKKFCVQGGCKSAVTVHGYCRFHYIANWKHIKFNKRVKAERRLNAYVDRLARKYPKDYLEKIKEGLESEEKFRETVQELDVDVEGNEETETEFVEKLIRTIKVGNE